MRCSGLLSLQTENLDGFNSLKPTELVKEIDGENIVVGPEDDSSQ